MSWPIRKLTQATPDCLTNHVLMAGFSYIHSSKPKPLLRETTITCKENKHPCLKGSYLLRKR